MSAREVRGPEGDAVSGREMLVAELEEAVRAYWTAPEDDRPYSLYKRLKDARAALATDTPAPQSALELKLCETEQLFLKPDVLYRFSVDPDCERCREIARIGDPSSTPDGLPVGPAPQSVPEGLRERLAERLGEMAKDEGCWRLGADPESTCLKLEPVNPQEWCWGCAAERAAGILASPQSGDGSSANLVVDRFEGFTPVPDGRDSERLNDIADGIVNGSLFGDSANYAARYLRDLAAMRPHESEAGNE